MHKNTYPSQTLSSTCQECHSTLQLPADTELGELIECPHCNLEWEVISLRPLHLSLFEEDEK